MDGSPTERSRMAGQMTKWANNKQYASLWQAKPVRGDLGILVVPESQIHCQGWYVCGGCILSFQLTQS